MQSEAGAAPSQNYANIEDVEETADVYMEMDVPEHLRDRSQRFCVMTVVAPEGTNQKSKEMAIRIYGCRATLQEANKWAKALRDSNNFWDVYTVKCHEWAALPPRIDQIEEIRTTEERVQKIHDQFKYEEMCRKKDLEKRMDAAHRGKKTAPVEKIAGGEA